MIGNHGVPMTSTQCLFKRFSSLDPLAVRVEPLTPEGMQQEFVIKVGIFNNQQANGRAHARGRIEIRRAVFGLGPVFAKPVRWGHGLSKGPDRPQGNRSFGQCRCRLMVARDHGRPVRPGVLKGHPMQQELQ